MLAISTFTFNLLDYHREELKQSAILDHILDLNFWSVEDPRELDKILNRNTQRRWHHSTELVPAWCVSGVDPTTGEKNLAAVQVKPDTPYVTKDGKKQKYISPTESEPSPLFLDTGDSSYWWSIIEDRTIPVIITEGAKKAAAGLSINQPTISIPGVSSCRKKGRLHQDLELFCQIGRTFLLCFDNDILFKQPVQAALLGLASKLASKGSNIKVVALPPGAEKGMDDFISRHGGEAFKTILSQALTFEEWRDTLPEQVYEKPKAKIAKQYELIKAKWGSSLRYNLLKKTVEFNGSSLDVSKLKLIIGLEFGLDISKEDAVDIIEFIARERQYNPVVDYLQECSLKNQESTPGIIDNLAQQLFGTDNPLHNIYIKNFLVGSVARAFLPGCWMDSALILVGKQGLRKSTFFRSLFGSDFFSDDLGSANDKDEKMLAHRFWALEWSEFETVYRKKDINQLKAFLSRKTETFRAPYDRTPRDYPRQFVLVGSTNEKEILADPTGNRRFWVIPVIKNIDIEWVIKNRDKIWAAAVKLFKEGYSWMLTPEMDQKRADDNQEYQTTHPWEELLSEFLSSRVETTVQQCFAVLRLEATSQTTGNQRVVTSILRQWGFEASRKKEGSRWVRVWVKRENLKSDGSGGSGGSVILQKVGTQDLQGDPLLLNDGSVVDHQSYNSSDPPLLLSDGSVVSQASSEGFKNSDPPDPSDLLKKGFTLPPPIQRTEITDYGNLHMTGTAVKSNKTGYVLKVEGVSGGEIVKEFTFTKVRGFKDATRCMDDFFEEWQREQMIDSKYKYLVQQLGEDDYIWVKDCICKGIPNPPVETMFTFQTSEGKTLRVRGKSEFKLMKPHNRG